MIRNLASVALCLSLASCFTYNSRGVFMAYMPMMDNYTCDSQITENFLNSDPPFAGYTGVNPWIYEYTASMSDEIVFFQIFESKNGEVVVDWGGTIFTGTVEKGVITVSWNNFENVTSRDTHQTAGYSFAENTDIQSITTITLTPNKEIKGYDGNVTVSYSDNTRQEERDLWDTTTAGFTSGDINGMVATWLVGYGTNQGDAQDCLQDPCYIEVLDTCSGSVGFTSVETDVNMDSWENVDGDGQPLGLGGNYGY